MNELERLMREATPRPWARQSGCEPTVIIGPNARKIGRCHQDNNTGADPAANARLICAAVNALPELLARVKRYETALSDTQNFLLERFAEWKRDNHPVFPDPEVDAVYTNVRAALSQETKHD